MHRVIWVLMAVAHAFMAAPMNAHDVVWPGNPVGLMPQEALKLAFGTTALIEVKPVFGEPCIVGVVLGPVESTLVKAEISTENPAQQVNIRVTALRAATNASEVVILRGEWHATGSPDPDECTAVMPNLFAIRVEVVGGPPAPILGGLSSESAPPGSTIVITGSGFSEATEVTFGGVKADFVRVDDRTIRTVVPSDAPVGKVAVNTPAGRIESAQVFVVQPELKILNISNNGVQLQWNERNYPFTLQRSASLIDSVWTDVLRTVDNGVSLPVDNRPAFYRLLWIQIPINLTDYNKDRAAVAQLYHRDPIAYWSTFGIPALARLALMRESLKADPYGPFQGLLEGFDESRFRAALQNNELPPPVSATVSNQLAAAVTLTNALVKGFMTLVKENDATNCLDIIRTNCVFTNTLAPAFYKTMTNFTTTNSLSGWAPATNKFLYSTNQLTNAPGINWIDTHGSHAFTEIRRPAPVPAHPDTNTTVKVKWSDIQSSTFDGTTYNGACASLAVGASLAKLGVLGADTTSQFWNELSRLLGATPGTLGALVTDINAFYETVGYGAAKAYDGPLESAVQEAKKALERGCDVQAVYYNTNGTLGHTEFVLGIDISANDSTKGTITTLSWGQTATVTYSGSITGGTFTGKSDGASYRKTNETSSWLEQQGTCILYYYCKK